MAKKYYAAYGSNLNIRQMMFRCPDARIIGTAELKNYRLLFKGSKTGAYLTVEKFDGGTVPLGIWEVSERDERNLDRYEGYPDFYYKTDIPLRVRGWNSGKTRLLTVFIYIMHEDRPLGISSERYLDTCFEGYMEFGFDCGFLYDADEISVKGAMGYED